MWRKRETIECALEESLWYCLCSAFKEYLECSHHSVRRQCGDDTARFTKDFLDRMSSSLLKVSVTLHCIFSTIYRYQDANTMEM